MKNDKNNLVLFNLADTIYAISSEFISSIVILEEVTKVPKVPEYVKGVVNIRGKIITLIDLRVKLGLKSIQEEIIDFQEMMEQRKKEHINWLTTLEKSVEEKTEFTLTTDPHACAFGKWYDNYKTNDVSIQVLLNKFDTPHKKIHSIAVDVKKLQEKNDFEDAKNIIEQTKNKELKKMIDLFASIIKEYKESKKEIMIVLEKQKKQIGILVDEVISVENLTEANEEALEGSIINKECFTGVGKRKYDTPVFILDIDHITNMPKTTDISMLTEQAL